MSTGDQFDDAVLPDLYADPAIYDILHAPGTAEDVGMLEKVEGRFAQDAPLVWLEPACGSGRYLRLAAKRGREAIGFDLEPQMIAYAQQRAERAGTLSRSLFFVGDMRDFASRVGMSRIGFAFNLINTVRHLENDADVLDHLAEVSRVLHPDGVYLIGISLTVYGLEPPSEDVWEGSRGRCHVSQSVQYLPPTDARGDRMEQVYSHLTITRPSGEEHRPSHYCLRSYDLEQWRSLIARSPMEVAGVVDGWGDPCEPSAPGYAQWVLRARRERD